MTPVKLPAPPSLRQGYGGLSEDDRPYVIHLENLEKTYDVGTPRETKALRGINLDISAGEIVVIFGPSGSGKSTLLNILAGLDKPTGGAATIADQDLLHMSARQLALFHQRQVGMVFQSYNLIPTFTVMQNITMPARLAGMNRSQYLARGRELLKQFKLEELAGRLPEECSGGQQQRVGIMRAFANRPSLIIADEPTGNLDSANTQLIMELFAQLNQETNTTMLIVTHDPTLFAIADRVVQILDGKVVKQIILTPRAKIDVHQVKEPIEFRYQEMEQVMEELGGSRLKQAEEEDAAARARQAAARRGELERLLEEEKKKMEAAWRARLAAAKAGLAPEALRQKEQRLQAQEAFLAQELARVNEELRRYKAGQNRLAAALAALEEQHQQAAERERQLLAKEWQSKDERAAIAVRRLELAVARQRLELQGRRAAGVDVWALERQRRQLAAARRQLTRRQAKLEAERQALERQRQRFDEEAQTRLAVASSIVEHEREQLETERHKQEEEQRQRAAAMERKLAAAGKIIDFEKAKLTVEYELIAKQRKELEEERRRLAAAQRPPARPSFAKAPEGKPTALDQLLAERRQFSAAAQHILAVLQALLTAEQKNRLARLPLLRLVEGIEYRLYDIFNQQELQAWLARPLAQGGAGLHRQPAEELAAAVESLISLGRLARPPQ